MNWQKNIKFLAITLTAIIFLAVLHFAYQNLFANAIKNQTAGLASVPEEILPVKKDKAVEVQISAQSALVVYVSNYGTQKNLFEKNINQKLLIASITKLMTAVIAQEHYKQDDIAVIDQYDVAQGGWLRQGESFNVKNLLYSALINSDNSAAYALSKIKNRQWFVDLMNQKAKDWGLQDTYFTNSVGFGVENKSTVQDLAKLAIKIQQTYPEVFKITRNQKYIINDSIGNFHHTAYSTNQFWPENIVGVKTGNNELAGECLLMIILAPNNNGYIINIVLNSKDRFQEIKKLNNYINDSFNF